MQTVAPADARLSSNIRRLSFLKGVLLVGFLIVAATLVKVQIIDSPRYKQIAQRQYEVRVTLPPTRGNIYDRTGNLLASNSLFISFAADPKVAENYEKQIAAEFSRAFGKPRRYYLDRLRGGKRFVWLERHLRPEDAARIRLESLPGIIKLNEPTRIYHYDAIAGPLLGFVNLDNVGVSGIELAFEQELRGEPGFVLMQRDGLGRARPTVDCLRSDPVNGNDITLSIDLMYQSVAEEKLQRGVERTNADGGLMVVLQPSTGEILAAAQYPGVNPNIPASSKEQHQKLRIFTDVFEPGSVFKVVTASAALESGLVRPQQKFYAEHGEYRVPLSGGKIRIIKDTHKYDMLTFQEAMEVSSNIVMSKVSNIIGAERLYTRARDFGFGIKTGVEYPGEVRGNLKRPNRWSGTTLNTMSYGYEVGVTPIQLAVAYGAIANGGLLMKPTLLKKITAPSGAVLHDRIPQALRQVILRQTADTLSRFFEGVVERGTAKTARIEGVRLAGKTGTARKHIDGHYEKGYYTASFIGFFPVENPEVVCLVMLDNPRNGGYTGGTTAAPIVKEFAQHVITTGKTAVPAVPSPDDQHFVNESTKVPDVCNLPSVVAGRLLEARGYRMSISGQGMVARQSPNHGVDLPLGGTVSLFLREEAVAGEQTEILVPDVRGLSARRAAHRLVTDSLEPVIRGSGIVINQMPEAGEMVGARGSVVLLCEPRRRSDRNN